MAIAFFVTAFAGVFLAMYRSLGWGFLAVIAVGYASGVIRANFLGVFTTLMFDAALLGLYVGFLSRHWRWGRAAGSGPARGFVLFLMAWPSFLCFVPTNHFLIECVALRAAIWFLPVLLIATRLTTADLAVVSRGLAVLNLMALAVGVYIFLFGVEALYPRNAVTIIIHKSKDVGGIIKHHRIPSSFLSAHAYGGTMLNSLPFLISMAVGPRFRIWDRGLAAAGVSASALGMLMCGARSPSVVLGLALVVAWVLSRASLKLALVVAVGGGAGLMVAGMNERFQRSTSLGDSEAVSQRIEMSANEGIWDLMADYPMGAGMGSAVGTSIPFFLADLAPEQIGLENEFSRILVEQGWLGLAGWLGLLVWLYVRPPSARSRSPWWLGVVLMYSLTLVCWATAFIGTGILTAVPGTFLLMTQMGLLIAVRSHGAVPEQEAACAFLSADGEVVIDPDAPAVEVVGDDPGLDSGANVAQLAISRDQGPR
jgi:hypothetical protein